MTMNDFDSLDEFDDANPPEESNNRTFLIVAGVLGFLVLVAMLCLGGYVLFNRSTPVRRMKRPHRHN